MKRHGDTISTGLWMNTEVTASFCCTLEFCLQGWKRPKSISSKSGTWICWTGATTWGQTCCGCCWANCQQQSSELPYHLRTGFFLPFSDVGKRKCEEFFEDETVSCKNFAQHGWSTVSFGASRWVIFPYDSPVLGCHYDIHSPPSVGLRSWVQLLGFRFDQMDPLFYNCFICLGHEMYAYLIVSLHFGTN